MTESRLIGPVRVVGAGLLGTSVGLGLRSRGLDVILADASPTHVAIAVDLGAGRPAGPDDAPQLVVVAVPPDVTATVVANELGAFPDAIVTDVASVKAPIVAAAVAAGLADRFAGAHPLAGTHGTGFDHASPDRLRGCVVYVCATGSDRGESAARGVSGFWQDTLGASAVRIDADAHDRQLAWTSHLPQAVASALAHALADRGLGALSFGSGGLDTTRLAASSPELWTDIFLQNAAPVAEALDAAQADAGRLAALIRTGDRTALRAYLDAAATFRRGLDR